MNSYNSASTLQNTNPIKLDNSRILIAGGTGFLGKHLHKELKKYTKEIFVSGRDWILENGHNAESLLSRFKPDYVFNLSGYNGGLLLNLSEPADIFYKNTVMGLKLIEACKNNNVKKVISVVASCAYPEKEFDGDGITNKEIMGEQDFFEGPPHDSVACHGYAKRNLQLASKFYNQQYGLNAVCVCPTTLYGPGDSFDPKRTKVMGATVKRFVDAVDNKVDSVLCYGSGLAKREFLYVEDAAQLLCCAAINYKDSDEPLNLGTGQEYSIKELSNKVAELAGFEGEIKWDKTKPDGQIRKKLDCYKMKKTLGDYTYTFTDIDTGIMKTIQDYKERKASGNA